MRKQEKLSWRVDIAVLLAAFLCTLVEAAVGCLLATFTWRPIVRAFYPAANNLSPDSLTLKFIDWPDPALIIAITIARGLFKSTRRLVFHPLAKFPGPKIAALTGLYEFYYDVIRGGQYTWTIQAMHAKHGPIVRISPSQLHVDDQDLHNHLSTGKVIPRDQWYWVTKLLQGDRSMLVTSGQGLDRTRRALEPILLEKVRSGTAVATHEKT